MTPAPRGVAASLRGAPQRAHGSQAASAIGSDLVPTWTGQAAAHGGHAGLAEVERVFSTFMYHLLVEDEPSTVWMCQQSGAWFRLCGQQVAKDTLNGDLPSVRPILPPI